MIEIIDFVRSDADGNITVYGKAQRELMRGIEGVGSPATHYVSSAGQIIAYTPEQAVAKYGKPDHPCTWSNINMAWVDCRTLSDVKREKRQAMKAEMEDRLVSGFSSSGYRFPSTVADQVRVLALGLQALAAKIDSQPFTAVVTTEDDEDVTLNRAGVLSLATNLQQMIDNAQNRFQARKEAIKAATTSEAVEAIVW